MNIARQLPSDKPKRKACLKGFSPDGAEVIISSDDTLEIIGGDPKNYNTLVRVAKTYLAIIKANGYDISSLTPTEFSCRELPSILSHQGVPSTSFMA